MATPAPLLSGAEPLSQPRRLLDQVRAWLLVHVYIITTGETVLTNLRAMLTGWHRESGHPSAERSESPS